MSTSLGLGRWNPRRSYASPGGGLLTSLPPSSLFSPLSDGEEEDLASSTTATAIEETESVPRKRARSIDSDEMDDVQSIDDDRAASVDATMSSSASNGKKAKATGKGAAAKGKGKGKEKPKKGKQTASYVAGLPFPQHFKDLEKTFKALNTVYTFCSSRKSLSLSYATLASTVSDLLKRPLEIHDIAQIKSLLPDLITFAWIDKELLRIHDDAAAGSSSTATSTTTPIASTSKRKETRMEVDRAYERVARGGENIEAETLASIEGSIQPDEDVVLQFQFNDGELKSSNGVGKVVSRKFNKHKQKKSETGVKTVVKPKETVAKYTTAGMQALISKRNDKFNEAVNELLLACVAHVPPLDPVALLLEATDDYLPVKPDDGEGGEENGESRRVGLKDRKELLQFYQRNPDQRPSVEKLIAELTEAEDYKEQIVEGGHRIVDAREAVYGDLDTPLSDAVLDALWATKKITRLYAHQSTALNLLAQGHNVIVSTSTSSGKTLVYQLPVLKALERDERSTALFVFPTKALAQDQKRALNELLSHCVGMEEVKIATFDGDTIKGDRDYIRENASVIFTNPDMIHLTILPREEAWRRFFQNLKFVVVDELHIYHGLFGTHVSLVMRRLRRICAAVGNHRVQFISCSATISNPIDHMKAIFGIDNVVSVDVDGSPSGKKEYLIWNPPFIDERDYKQGRVSTITEASRLFRFLMDRGVRAIVFCKVRKMCEILMKQVRADLLAEGRNDMASRVMSYRSGYSAEDRRRIEQQMFSGQLLGIVATTALELGIDLGSLDCVLTVGFPYTLPGFRQQAGRAGRRNKDSLAILITDPFPLDQHYARFPAHIFDSKFTELVIDLTNPIVLQGHLQCAADELPMSALDDAVYFGETTAKICDERLMKDDEGWYHAHPQYKPYPAQLVPIRSTEDESYSIIDVSNGRNKVMEEIELSRAIFTIYEGAVFMSQGNTYLVKTVDHVRKLATIEAATIEYSTRQRDFTNVDALEALSIREIKDSDCSANYGTVRITSVVFGYYKTDRRNNILDTVDLSTPPFVRDSNGFWIDIPRRALDILALKNIDAEAAVHASEHALLSLTPIVSMSQLGDVKTECRAAEKETGKPGERRRLARIILYDASGKSSGVCAKGFDNINLLLTIAADTIKNCRCEEGCPSCVASAVCSGANTLVSKLGALIILESILGRSIDVDAIPRQAAVFGSEEYHAAIAEMKRSNPGKGGEQMRAGEMEEEEMTEEEYAERERVLQEVMRGSSS